MHSNRRWYSVVFLSLCLIVVPTLLAQIDPTAPPPSSPQSNNPTLLSGEVFVFAEIDNADDLVNFIEQIVNPDSTSNKRYVILLRTGTYPFTSPRPEEPVQGIKSALNISGKVIIRGMNQTYTQVAQATLSRSSLATEDFNLIHLRPGAELSLYNIVIQNGKTKWGGGIFNEGGTLKLYNTTLQYNEATSEGGGVYNYNNGTVNLANTLFKENTAPLGGGIANYQDTSDILTLYTSNKYCVEFRENAATGLTAGKGAVLYNKDGNVNIRGGIFLNNSSPNSPRDIYNFDANPIVNATYGFWSPTPMNSTSVDVLPYGVSIGTPSLNCSIPIPPAPSVDADCSSDATITLLMDKRIRRRLTQEE